MMRKVKAGRGVCGWWVVGCVCVGGGWWWGGGEGEGAWVCVREWGGVQGCG